MIKIKGIRKDITDLLLQKMVRYAVRDKEIYLTFVMDLKINALLQAINPEYEFILEIDGRIYSPLIIKDTYIQSNHIFVICNIKERK